jgi:hypothetical protein
MSRLGPVLVAAVVLSAGGAEQLGRGAVVNGATSSPKGAQDAGLVPGRGVPAPAPRPTPTAASRGQRRDPLDWRALARCESHGNPRALSRTGRYRGLYQFDLNTWRWVGGTGDPIDATPDEQTYRARLLFQRAGTRPWPVCGQHLRRHP